MLARTKEEENMETLEFFLAAYLSVGFARLILSMPRLPTALMAWQKLTGSYEVGAAVFFVVVTVVVCLLWWPRILIEEGYTFFLLKSRYSVLREIAEGVGDNRLSPAQRKLKSISH